MDTFLFAGIGVILGGLYIGSGLFLCLDIWSERAVWVAKLANRVDYRHALPIFHITSTCLGRGLCVARNAEPTVTKEKPRPLSGVAEINASLLRVLSRRHIEYIRDDRRSSRWDIR